MAKVLISDQYLTDIGNAIRNKNGSSNTYTPAQMGPAILAISTGSANPTLQAKTATPTAATQVITADANYDGLSQVTISGDANLIASNIRSGATIFGVAGTVEIGDVSVMQANKTVAPTTSQQIVTPDTGYTGLSQVTVGAVNATSLNVTANGTYTAGNGNFYSTVTVAIEDSKVNLQSKTATPSTTIQSVVPDTGYHGLSSVTINPIPSNYADVSTTTATANDVLSGKTFINSAGTPKTGLLVTSSYYVGSAIPDFSIGEDGDLYLKI